MPNSVASVTAISRGAYVRSVAALAFFIGVLSGGAGANDSDLRKLQTGTVAEPWEAVGRLNIDGKGFCTGALIEPDIVLTAAHCLYDKKTGRRVDYERVEFLAGWRNGRASAYRDVRRAVVHPDYSYSESVSWQRVSTDLALLELTLPIRNTRIEPFGTASQPDKGDQVGVVSYARDRADAPSLQEVCNVLGSQEGVLVTSCQIDFGSSGAPIFSFEDDGAVRIVSVVSAMAEISGQDVSLGTDLTEPLQRLRAELARGGGFEDALPPAMSRITVGGKRNSTGAKFVRPQE